MEKLTYGDHSVDFDGLPEATRYAIAHEGFVHFLGNRVASRVAAWCESQAGENATKEAVKAWKDSHPDAVNAQAGMFRTSTLEAMLAGTLGVRSSSGPRAASDPLGAEMRRIAKEQIMAILSASGLKFPVGKDESGAPKTITIRGVAVTGEQLVTQRLDPDYPRNNREAIEAEAKRNLAAKAKAAAKLSEAGIEGL